MTATDAPAPRPTVRAIVLDAADRVLLQAYLDPAVHRPGGAPHATPVWIAPGGGLRPGEDPAAGLARELNEETGLRDVAWGPWLWLRTIDLHYEGQVRRFTERYRLARVDASTPPIAPRGLEPHERSVLLGHRWWVPAELGSAAVVVYPPRLVERLGDARNGACTVVDISADG